MDRKILYIEWEDSICSNGWRDNYKINPKNLKHQSIGWLLEDAATHITIAHSRGMNDTSFCDSFTIPKRAILKKKWIKVG